MFECGWIMLLVIDCMTSILSIMRLSLLLKYVSVNLLYVPLLEDITGKAAC